MTINAGNLFVFEVEPSVKFVSAIIDAIFNQKMGVNFLFGKNAKPRGVWQKTTLFPDFFVATFPNRQHSLKRVIFPKVGVTIQELDVPSLKQGFVKESPLRMGAD